MASLQMPLVAVSLMVLAIMLLAGSMPETDGADAHGAALRAAPQVALQIAPDLAAPLADPGLQAAALRETLAVH